MDLPKSITAKRVLLLCLFLFSDYYVSGQAGTDGPRVISSPNTVVNAYTTLQSNAASGGSSVQVVNNSLNLSFPSPLNTGDLIFIYQVQGASISTPDNSSYGNITAYQNCGKFELAEVSSVSGTNTINLFCPLQNSYTASGNVIVARVPRYSSLTINNGASITCPAWNGTTGGICIVEVTGATVINSGGSIDVSGKGFRGGALVNNNSAYNVTNFRVSGLDLGAEKGESIAGDGVDYDLIGGRYCKGAPANGGGGGNGHNTGGGGGSNAGNISSYTGMGNPDISNPSWMAAWNLESPGFATSTSSGGGRGGYAFGNINQDALTVAPSDPSWGGDFRQQNGGRGGKPLDYSTGRIFMGGGGGAGEQNDSEGGAGGSGGGIIYFISYDGISGSGQVLANGFAGSSTNPVGGKDGAGGGGGGGTVILNTSTAVSGISIQAIGGDGGSQALAVTNPEVEGPGGGGGGGYIALSNGSVTRNANGGANGETNSVILTEFPSNGATMGGQGISNAVVNAFRILPDTINLCSSSSTTLTVASTGTSPSGITYTWYDQQVGGNVIGTGTTYTTPVLNSSTTYYVGSCPGIIRTPYRINVSGSLSASFISTTVCAGSSTNFSASGVPGIISWSWDFGDGTGTSIQQSPSYTYSSGGNYPVTLIASDGVCSTSVTQTTVVNVVPDVNYTSSAPASGCGPLTVSFTNNSSNASGYSWNFGDGTPLSTQNNPTHTYASAGTYTVILTATADSGCTDSETLSITVGPAPTASFISNNIICQGDTVYFTNLSSGNGSIITSLNWNFGDGSPVSTATNPFHRYSGTGVFNVTLTASSALCSDDTVISVTVNSAPVAGFNVTNPVSCGNFPVTFNNTSTGTPSYSWNFGDGSPLSTQVSPVHTYVNPGTYSVTLITTQGSCSDTSTQINLIQISNPPLSSFSTNNVCTGDSSRFVNSSNGNGSTITTYSWDFGDGSFSNSISPAHLYLSQGTFAVTLTIGTGQCTDDTTLAVNVNPSPVVSFTSSVNHACDSATVQFVNSSTLANSYSWTFGDGNTSTATSPVHAYTLIGSYTVSLTATTNNGCSVTRASLNMINVHPTPVASVIVTSGNICPNDCINFTGQSSSPVSAWTWTFNGAATSASVQQSPSNICYPVNGSFDVTLNVSNGFCESTLTQPSFIDVVDCTAKPVADFISGDTNICANSCIDFVSLSSNATSWMWHFPGATPSSSALEHPVNICYNNPGVFDVVLIAGNPTGFDTIESSGFIMVYAPPAIPVIVQNGNTLTSTSAQLYQWYLNNIPISGATSQQFVAMLPGYYTVSITNAGGCSELSLPVYVSFTGIENRESDFLFYVYPNPAHDEIAIFFKSKKLMNLTVSLYDITGASILFERISVLTADEIYRFDLSEHAPGTYFLRIQSDDKSFIRLVIKQ